MAERAKFESLTWNNSTRTSAALVSLLDGVAKAHVLLPRASVPFPLFPHFHEFKGTAHWFRPRMWVVNRRRDGIVLFSSD